MTANQPEMPENVQRAAEAAADYIDRVISDEFPGLPVMCGASLSQMVFHGVLDVALGATEYARVGEP